MPRSRIGENLFVAVIGGAGEGADVRTRGIVQPFAFQLFPKTNFSPYLIRHSSMRFCVIAGWLGS